MQPGTVMRVVSVNVGLPRIVESKGKPVETGIFKEPVAGPVAVRRLNLDGDRQADLTVHGGPEKAVYTYPAEHYPFWRAEYPDLTLPWGMFGENLTTEGLAEDVVCIGDRFIVGTAEMQVTQPRMPCYKLGIKFGRDDILKRFLASRFSGIYCAVTREGAVAAGDPITLLERATHGVTVADITDLYVDHNPDRDRLRMVADLPALAEVWRAFFHGRLAKRGA